MQIAMDSNVFFADPNFKGAEWKLFSEYQRRRRPAVVVPEVVIHEVVNTFGERLQIIYSKGRSQAESAGWLCGTDIQFPQIDVTRERNSFEVHLRGQLRNWGVTLLPVPTVPHTDLIRRDLQRKKPFTADGEGKGYRDYLIWLSIVTYMQGNPDDELVLITKNVSDFCHSKQQPETIHADLQADLTAAGVRTRVVVCDSLTTFIESRVKPSLTKLDNLKEAIARREVIDVKEYLRTHFDEVYNSLGRAKLRVRIPGVDIEEPFGVTELGEPDDVEVIDVYELSDDEVYIECSATYDASIDGFLFHADAYGLDEDSGVSVIDWDWNEHYARVEASVNLDVTFGLTWNTEEEEVVDLEVTEAETVDEY